MKTCEASQQNQTAVIGKTFKMHNSVKNVFGYYVFRGLSVYDKGKSTEKGGKK